MLTDSVVQEIDIKTGLVMWEWHALGHIPLRESHNPAPRASYPWDYVHINSISPGSAGDVLLSSRNTWTIYDVDMHSGAISWRLGGSQSSFRLGPGTRFYWQHDAEFQPGGPDLGVRQRLGPAQGEAVTGPAAAPNLANHTVTLVKQFVNPAKDAARLEPGQHPQPARRQLADRLRRAAELHRVRRVRPRPARRHARQERPELQDLPVALERPAGGPAVGRRDARPARGRSRSRRAGTAPPTWPPGGCSREPRRARLRRWPRPPKAAFRRRSQRHAAGPYVAVQALDGSGTVIGTSATVKG